jgi:hypothetical protein
MGTNFIKVRTRLILDPRNDIENDYESEIYNFSSNFWNKINIIEEDFRSQIIIQINNLIGFHNWAIIFVQVSRTEPFYFADIYADNLQDFNIIREFVSDKLSSINLSFYYTGTIEDYLN